MTATGFHEGEIATQRRAGVETDAKRLERMLDSARISAGAARFLSLQNFAALTGRDGEGSLWISPLTAPPGFLRGSQEVLQISASPREGDPLQQMSIGQQIGLIAIDMGARRRLRINGVLLSRDGSPHGPEMTVRVEQAYGNCPQYIRPHQVNVAALRGRTAPRRASILEPAAVRMIETAETFFLGTTHPTRGSDASHRGGPAGFVRVESPRQLWWPDYPGNNMFNTFGNLAVNDEAALLFVDFGTGATLHVSGTAEVQWITPGAAGDDGGVGRRVVFSLDTVVTG
jgi:predicted pyridoxine 5'-phosphate oxidase superfamily flavin-nucleotide-binding protein